MEDFIKALITHQPYWTARCSVDRSWKLNCWFVFIYLRTYEQKRRGVGFRLVGFSARLAPMSVRQDAIIKGEGNSYVDVFDEFRLKWWDYENVAWFVFHLLSIRLLLMESNQIIIPSLICIPHIPSIIWHKFKYQLNVQRSYRSVCCFLDSFGLLLCFKRGSTHVILRLWKMFFSDLEASCVWVCRSCLCLMEW